MKIPRFVNKNVLLYVIMVLIFGIFVNEQYGSNLCSGPCEEWVWDGSKWVCEGCDYSYCDTVCIDDSCKRCGGDTTKRCCPDGSHCCPRDKSCCGSAGCCDPDQCQKCVEGSCATGICLLETEVIDESGIKCDCESSYCRPAGQITYIYHCNGNDCYGNCGCTVHMGLKLGARIPTCEDIGVLPPGPECDETSDCLFIGWYELYGMAPALCICEP